jgi:hypothetical protein
MTHSTAGVTGTTTLLFKAPPAPPRDEAAATSERPKRAGGGGPGQAAPTGGRLRMLKGARAAASGMRISDDEIRAVLDDPHDVQPDPNQPHRTRLHRDGLVVTTGNDGMILRVARQR